MRYLPSFITFLSLVLGGSFDAQAEDPPAALPTNDVATPQAPVTAPAEALADASEKRELKLSPAQMLALADKASEKGDFALAEKIYRIVSENPVSDTRNEARFRLGMMLADRQQKYSEAAIEFRRILDEKPDTARVRLELARMFTLMGDEGKARREFRAAEAAGLPPEVQRMVRFYSNALAARKHTGLSLDIALAPDTNVNRATTANYLPTVFGENAFTLQGDARRKSGIGLSVRGQGFAKFIDGEKLDILARTVGSANLYKSDQFNFMVGGLQAGGEYRSGTNRFTVMVGPTWSWFGNSPYSFTFGETFTWQRPIAKKMELQLEGGMSRTVNRKNSLQDANNFSLSAQVDRAFTAQSGGGLQLSGYRELARDPGYSNKTIGVTAYYYREIGRTTAVATAGYSHLEADAQIRLYTKKRFDDRFNVSLTGTFRGLSVGRFAPLLRLRWEKSNSTIVIYDYKRLAAEIGITSSF